MQRVRTRHEAARLLAVYAVLVIALLGAAAWFLAHTQSEQRQNLRDRYGKRTELSSSLVSSLFQVAFAGQAQQNSERFGTRDPTQAQLDAAAKRANVAYVRVVDPRGKVVATTSGAPAMAGVPAHVRTALRRGYGVSDVLPRNLLESAIAYRTKMGPRVWVQGQPLQAFATFLNGSLKPLPSLKGSVALVVDGHGRTIGGAAYRGPLRVPPELRRELADTTKQGSYAGGGEQRFFATAPLPNTSWRSVVDTPEDELFATVIGTDRWLPWLILALGALALTAVGVLLWRLLRSARELAASRHAVELRALELERSNEDLEQFAYAASHDLSEPLRTVAGFSQLLRSRYAGRLDPDADEYITHMADGVERMQQLIDDLLMYSRVGRSPLREENVDLEALLAEVLDWLAPSIDERGAHITHDPLPVVRGERSELAQVLQNLLTNAMKFTAPGVAPEVHLWAVREGDVWRVAVRDNGIGVGDDDEVIFKMFGRLHPNDAYPGTGIGLALAKRVIERHGGRIWVDPAPEGGSVFTFTVQAGTRAAQPALEATA